MLNRWNVGMNPLLSGLVAGLIFGAVDVCLMLPMSFPDKRTALFAAFFSRFGIGLVIALIQLPSWPGWLLGLVFGLLLKFARCLGHQSLRANSAWWRYRWLDYLWFDS